MNNIFKNATFDFACPSCNNKFKVSVNSIGNTINCPHCRQIITFKDNGFNKSLDDANRQLNNLTNKFKR